MMNLGGTSRPDSDFNVCHRRIDFYAERNKPFNGYNYNGFKLVNLNPNANSDSKSTKRSENFGLDPELSFGITFRRIGAGLRNLGNTCYLNSVLQCLTYTEPLAAYLQSGKHQNSCHASGFCALCAIQKHVSHALKSSGRILEPTDLVSNLRRISRSFRNARQEDAHEYMVNLLESMHKCCLPLGVPSESPSAYEKSLVHKIFGGRLRSQIKCMQCSFCSDTFDPFLDLSLDIFRADSLYKALAHFTAKEHLDGGSKQYQCQGCNQKVKALKQLTIYKATHVLAIHLKRFGSYVEGQKINKYVAFGPTLDLKPFVTGSYDGDLKYTLYGVLVHAGWSTHSGHYYCFVRTSTGMWYSLDDNQVVQVNERKVLEQKAYMLFYVRDRKNFVTKKPVDIIQKENTSTNDIRNASQSKLNMEFTEKNQDGSIQKKLPADASIPTAPTESPFIISSQIVNTSRNNIRNASQSKLNLELTEKNQNGSIQEKLPTDAAIPTAPKESPFKNISSQTVNTSTNDIRNASYSQLNLELTEKNQNGSIQKKLFMDAAIPTAPKKSPFIISFPIINGVTAEANHLSVVTPRKDPINDGLATNVIDGSPNVVQDQNASIMQLPDDMSPQDSHKDSANGNSVQSAEHPLEMPGTNSERVIASSDDKPMSIATIKEASNEIVSISIEESQVVDCHIHTVNPTIEATQEIIHIKIDVQSNSSSTSTEQSPSCEISNQRILQPKTRRNLFKCRVSSMQLSSNIMFGVYSDLKKNKKRKYRLPKNKNPDTNHFLGQNGSPSDIGASTSDKSSAILIGGDSKRKKTKYDSDDGDKNLTSQDISRNQNVTEKQPPPVKNPSCQELTNSENCNRESTKNDTMSMLTRGLEETTVSCWDGIDVPRTDQIGGKENGQIGYIGDEWDEEYDRGKRKKLRDPKFIFDGTNFFQEVATKHAKRKRGKPNILCSENFPFRI